MPRPNHPTDAEYDNALDSAAHYRLKCLKLEEERDTLLAVLEQIKTVAFKRFDGVTFGPDPYLSKQWEAVYTLAQDAIAKGGE